MSQTDEKKEGFAATRRIARAFLGVKTFSRRVPVRMFVALFFGLCGAQAAQAQLTIQPASWNVIGLDSNRPQDGPAEFPVGARVCNTGGASITNLSAQFFWDSSNTYINLKDPSRSTLTTTSLAAGACVTFYFEVAVTRNSAAFDTTRRFHITAQGNGTPTVSTPTPRELYIEKLISQGRNSVQSITGPTTVYVGQTYTYTVNASTATGGYEQLEAFLNLSSVIFEVQSVNSTYTAPSGGTNDKIYADACGWQNNPTLANYRSCVGPDNYAGGKAGGTIRTIYTVKVLSTGATVATTLIRDFSGSSYHYNSDFGTDTISITALLPPSDISGTVFEDVNYGGGAGRSLAASAGAGRLNARVELYNSSGNFVTSTTTGASGQYTFAGVAAGNYTVRVVNATVTSSRPGAVATLLPVQTFRTTASSGAAVADTNRVGGEGPAVADAGNGAAGTTMNTTTGAFTAGITGQAQSIAPVTLSGANLTGLDFGFNFDTIVNTNNSGQGSLRQFIINSNALTNTGLNQAGLTAGVETSLFMISDGAAHPGLRAGLTNLFSGGTATINLASALPAITDANTAIDGTRQTAITGDTNPAINESTTGPEIIVNGNSLAGPGLQTTAANTLFDRLGVTGVSGAAAVGAAIYFNGAGTSGSIIRNSTLFSNQDAGINLRNGATGVQVLNNVVRNNGIADPDGDGVELVGANNNTVSGNQILNNAGYGIDLHTTASNGNTFTNNLVKNNGFSATSQDAGIGLRTGSNNTVSLNTITGNQGDGIVLITGTGNTFTQNSIFANGNLAVDLGGGDTGNGVTINDNGDADAGANDLLNFPVLTSARISGANLVLSGFARPGAIIEFFIAAPDPTNFGEGQTYLVTLTEGSAADTDATAGAYTSPVNGLNVGADNTNRFQFTVAIPAGVSAGTVLAATATLAGSTSEFSGNVTVMNAPPNITLVKSVNPPDGSTQLPGVDLTYTIAFTNAGGTAAANFVLTDPNLSTAIRINDNTDFKVGSVTSDLGTTGLTVALSYSNDGGASYAYTPAGGSGGAPAGYDRNVTHVRWTFTGALSSTAPNNAGSVGFTVRIH